MSTAIVTHKDCILHDTGSNHPESKERLIAINKILKEFKSKRFVTKGSYVNTGTPVFELVNNEEFEIEANIPSDKISLLNKKKYERFRIKFKNCAERS